MADPVPSPDPAPTPAPTPAPESTSSQYNKYGYFQPTDEQVNTFQQLVANPPPGFDIEKLDPRFRASMYLHTGGDPLATDDTAKTLVVGPMRDARLAQQNQDRQQVVTNPLGFVFNKGGDALNWIGAQYGSIKKSLDKIDAGITGHPDVDAQNLASLQLDEKDGLGNTVTGLTAFGARAAQEGSQAVGSGAKSLLDAVTFNFGAASKDLAEARQHAMNLNVLTADSSAKGISQAANLIDMGLTYLPHLASDSLLSMPGVPQQVKDFVRDRDDQGTIGVLRFQRNMDSWSKDFAGKVTQNLANTGIVSQAVADQARQSEASITPAQLEGGSTVFSPFNYVGPALSLHGLGMATKPVFTAAIEESSLLLQKLTAEEVAANSKLGAAQALRNSGTIPFPDSTGKTTFTNPADLDKNIFNLQANLDRIKQASQAALIDHQRQIQQAGNSMQTSAGAASRIAGTLSQGTSKVLAVPGIVGKWVDQRVNNIATRMAGATPELIPKFQQSIHKWIESGAEVVGGAALGASHGGGVGAAEGMVGGPLIAKAAIGTAKVLGLTPDKLSQAFSILGREFMAGEATSPFWRRVADQTSGAPQWVALGLDNSFVNDVTRTISGAANAGLEAGGVNAAIANAGSWGNPQATAQGFVSGSILGMAGGGFKVWRDYGSADQLSASQVGDRYRFLQSLDSADTAKQFRSLTPELQLSMGTYFGQHPDLGLKFDAPPGGGSSYTTSGNLKDGYTATIHVDPAQPETAILAQIGHEFNHHLEQRGMASELYAKLLGDSRAGTPGLFTKLDDAGNPVKGADGNYRTNDQFAELRTKLQAHYAAQGYPDEVLTDQRVVRELASESAVARVSPGSVVPRKSFAEKLLDTGTAPFVNKNFVKTVLASLGNGFDHENQIVGTGLFTGEKRIPLVDSILKEWYEGRRQQSPLDSGDPTFVTTKDLIGKTDAQIRSLSGAVDAFQADKNGKLARRNDGSPILKTTGQLEGPTNKAGQALHNAISKMDEGQRQAAGILPDGEGGYHITDVQKAQSLLERQLTRNQMDVLNSMKGIMDGAPGTGVWMRYHPAYRRGPYKQPIPDALPIKDVSAMPLFTKVTKAGNILIHALDHGQLLENATAEVKKGNGSEWGHKPAAVVEAARTMLEAMAKGQPSESVVTPTQKKFLYQLTGLDPKVNGVDVFSDISRKARSESIYKTYRVDRIHSATVDSTHNWKLQHNIYDALKEYKSGNKSFSEELERIKAAAIRSGDQTFEGPAHYIAHEKAGPGFANAEEGFTTNQGRFLNREEARNLALKNGQMQRNFNSSSRLYSEDIQNENQTLRSGSQKFAGFPLTQRPQINGPETARSGLAASMASQQGPDAFKRQLSQTTETHFKEIAEPAQPVQQPRAQLVQPEVRRAEPVEKIPVARYHVNKYFQQGNVGSSKVADYLQDIVEKEGEPAMKRILARTLNMSPQYLEAGPKKYVVPQVPKEYEEQALQALKGNRDLFHQMTDPFQPDPSGSKRINAVYNNPGALGLSDLGRRYGAVASGKFDTGHPFAAFPSKEAGAAAQFALWRESHHYVNQTLRDAIKNWVGPGETGEDKYISEHAGIPLDHVITEEFLRGPGGIRLMQAQAHYEGANVLSPEEWKRGQDWAYKGKIPSTGKVASR